MPAPSATRLVRSLATVGLATTVLGIGLVGAPMLADAAPTPSPTPAMTTTAPEPSAGASSANSPSSEQTAATSTASPSASDDASPTPTPSSSTSAASDDPAEETSASPDESGTSAAGRVGSDAIEAPAPTAGQSASDQVQAQAEGPAGISLTKTASPSRVANVGQVVTYTFVATNTGTVALGNVRITDDLDGLSDVNCSGSVLPERGDALTCSATLTVTQDWLDFGAIDNSATVFGEFGSEGAIDYVGANASAHVAVDQKPSIALDASVSPTGTVDAGDRLRYATTATNTGNVTLTTARVTSSLGALDLDCEPSARATLAPGQSIDCSGSYQVTRADARRGRVSNLLTARADAPYGDDVTDDTRLRVAVNKPADDAADSGLADTGGPGGALAVGVLGVAALLAGGDLLRRGRRRAR